MAAGLRVKCPDCGPVVLLVAAVKVYVSRVEGAGARYGFDCPCCKGWVSRRGNHLETKMLLRAGCPCDVVPREVLEHPDAGQARPIGDLEVDLFVDALRRCDDPVAQLDRERVVR